MSYYYQGPQDGAPSGGTFLDLKRNLRILAKRKWIAIFFFLAVVVAVVVHTRRQVPIYQATAAYGHFGRENLDLTWERTDKAETLRKDAGL